MKKYTVLGVAGLFLVIFFQNCGKVPESADTSTQVGVVSPNQQYNKYAMEDFPILSLWDYKLHRYLDLDLKTGRMVSYEENGQVRGDVLQLPSERLTEVQGILQGAEICEPLVDLEARQDRMCTMIYSYPYAILSSKTDEVRLGERTDGCDVPVDLCGSKSELLREFTRSVVESL